MIVLAVFRNIYQVNSLYWGQALLFIQCIILCPGNPPCLLLALSLSLFFSLKATTKRWFVTQGFWRHLCCSDTMAPPCPQVEAPLRPPPPTFNCRMQTRSRSSSYSVLQVVDRIKREELPQRASYTICFTLLPQYVSLLLEFWVKTVKQNIVASCD